MMKKIIFPFLFLYSLFISSQDINYSDFQGYDVKINQISKIEEAYILDYHFYPSIEIDSIAYKPFLMGSLEKSLYAKHKEVLSIDPRNTIKLLFKITYKSGDRLQSIINFYLKTNDTEKRYLFLAEKTKNDWIEIKRLTFEDFIEISKNISSEMFWQFYNDTNDPSFSEINKLKPLVKDANGILNIEKLAQVLKENRSTLSKYLDQ